MALGELVKSLIIRFKVDGWELAKEKIDSIPDEKTVKLDIDSSLLSPALFRLKTAMMGAGYDSGQGFWRAFFSNAAFRGFGGLNLPGRFLPNLPSFFTSGTGIAAIAAAVGTLVTFVDMLASGFVAAGMGVAAFGALAYPTLSTISGAVSKIGTDTATYDSATTKAAKSAALKTIRADWAALDPVQKTAVKNVQALQSQWDKLAANFESKLAPILDTLLQGPQKELLGFRGGPRGRAQPVYGKSSGGIIYQLLNDLPKFADIAAKALDPLLKQFDKFLSSPGAKEFMKQMQGIEKLALPAIGQGIGKVVTAFGKLFTVFSAKDDARAIRFAFDVIVFAIDAVILVLKSYKIAWDAVSRAFGPVIKYLVDQAKVWWKATAGAVGDVIHAFDNVRHFVAVAAGDVGRFIKRMAHDIWQWAFVDVANDIKAAVAWFKGLPGRIVSAVGNLGKLLWNVGASIIQGLWNGMKSAVGGFLSWVSSIGSMIAAHKGPIEVDRVLLYPHGQAIMQGLMAGIGSQVPALNAQLGGITSGIATAAGRGRYGHGGGDTYIFNVAPLTDPHKTAMEIQHMLLTLKRRRGFAPGSTGSGLGLA